MILRAFENQIKTGNVGSTISTRILTFLSFIRSFIHVGKKEFRYKPLVQFLVKIFNLTGRCCWARTSSEVTTVLKEATIRQSRHILSDRLTYLKTAEPAVLCGNCKSVSVTLILSISLLVSTTFIAIPPILPDRESASYRIVRPQTL